MMIKKLDHEKNSAISDSEYELTPTINKDLFGVVVYTWDIGYVRPDYDFSEGKFMFEHRIQDEISFKEDHSEMKKGTFTPLILKRINENCLQEVFTGHKFLTGINNDFLPVELGEFNEDRKIYEDSILVIYPEQLKYEVNDSFKLMYAECSEDNAITNRLDLFEKVAHNDYDELLKTVYEKYASIEDVNIVLHDSSRKI